MEIIELKAGETSQAGAIYGAIKAIPQSNFRATSAIDTDGVPNTPVDTTLVEGDVLNGKWTNIRVLRGRLLLFPETATDEPFTEESCRELLSALDKETVSTASGSVTAHPTPTTFIKFVNQTTPVILSGMIDVEDGKEITIWNQSLQDLDLLNESPAAAAENRLVNLGFQDILLPIDAKVIYRYSGSLQRWTMVIIEGSGYIPPLKGTNTRAVTVLPSGTLATEDIAEFRVYNEAINVNQTNADLNILYPEAFQGFTVVCKNNGREYEMDDENARTWIWAPLNIVS